MSDESLWSQNALAHEFDMDRRTVKVRLKGVRPAGHRHGYPVYRMRDVAHLLKAGATRPPSNSDIRDNLVKMYGEAGADLIDATRDPLSVGIFVATRRMISDLPGYLAPVLAAGCALSIEQAFSAFQTMAAGLIHYSVETLGECDAIPNDMLADQDLKLWPWPPEPDWDDIATGLGVKFDRDACQAFFAATVEARYPDE